MSRATSYESTTSSSISNNEDEEPSTPDSAAGITPTGVLGMLVLAAGLGWYGGVLGLASTVPVALVWIFGSAPFAVAVAFVIVGVLTPPIRVILVVSVSLGGFLLVLGDVPAVARARPIGLVLGSSLFGLGLAVVAYSGLHTIGLWMTPLVLATSFALVSYTMHRYTIVRRQQLESP
jgi:uncharacterized membrane protein